MANTISKKNIHSILRNENVLDEISDNLESLKVQIRRPSSSRIRNSLNTKLNEVYVPMAKKRNNVTYDID